MNKVRLPDTCIRDETEHGKEYVLLADVRTYGDQRAAEAREQMREECVKLFNEISKAAWAKWLVECDPHQRGVSMGANACEKVIKELK